MSQIVKADLRQAYTLQSWLHQYFVRFIPSSRRPLINVLSE